MRAISKTVTPVLLAALGWSPAGWAADSVLESLARERLILGGLATVGVLLLLLIIVRGVHAIRQRKTGLLRLITELSLGRGERVAIVQVGQRYMVLGVTSNTVTRLGEYDSLPELASARATPASPAAPFGVSTPERQVPVA